MLLQGVSKSLLTKDPASVHLRGNVLRRWNWCPQTEWFKWVSEPLGISHSAVLQEKAMEMTVFLVQC